jgi:hypothetical protein
MARTVRGFVDSLHRRPSAPIIPCDGGYRRWRSRSTARPHLLGPAVDPTRRLKLAFAVDRIAGVVVVRVAVDRVAAVSRRHASLPDAQVPVGPAGSHRGLADAGITTSRASVLRVVISGTGGNAQGTRRALLTSAAAVTVAAGPAGATLGRGAGGRRRLARRGTCGNVRAHSGLAR